MPIFNFDQYLTPQDLPQQVASGSREWWALPLKARKRACIACLFVVRRTVAETHVGHRAVAAPSAGTESSSEALYSSSGKTELLSTQYHHPPIGRRNGAVMEIAVLLLRKNGVLSTNTHPSQHGHMIPSRAPFRP